MKTIITPIETFADNYVWTIGERDGDSVAVVDPGEATPVLDWLQQNNKRLAAILVTHHHRDHIGGVAGLLSHHRAPVYGPRREAAAVVTHPLADGQRLSLPAAGIELEVMETPGHTLGHVAYYARPTAQNTSLLFCGDTLFSAGCGRLFEGTAAQLHASLQRFAALPADTSIFPAHEYTEENLRFACCVEPDNTDISARCAAAARLRAIAAPTLPCSLAEELATNPFLRINEAAVIAAVAARSGRAPADALACFSVLRQWRDEV